jgi:hypothetical protein
LALATPSVGRAAADRLGGRFVQLDVTDDDSVAAVAATVGALDVLVNNAGISGGSPAPGGSHRRPVGAVVCEAVAAGPAATARRDVAGTGPGNPTRISGLTGAGEPVQHYAFDVWLAREFATVEFERLRR